MNGDRIAELKARSEQIAALQAKLNPQPQPPSFEADWFRLPQYDAEGPGQMVQPGGTVDTGSYAAAGITEPTEVAFAQAAHLEPATAKLLLETVRSLEIRDPAPNLLSGYTAGARSLTDAEMQRTNHVLEAKQALDSIGGAYAAKLRPQLDKLPRSALDLLIKTVSIKKRVVEDRPR